MMKMLLIFENRIQRFIPHLFPVESYLLIWIVPLPPRFLFNQLNDIQFLSISWNSVTIVMAIDDDLIWQTVCYFHCI